MPELPEVETIRRQASEKLIGMKITDAQYKPSKVAKGDLRQVIGKRVTGVRRFGKLLVLDLQDNFSLCVHLKMTGQLTLQSEKKPEPKYAHITFMLGNNQKLIFSDLRKFGYVHVLPTDHVVKQPFVRSLGKEMLKDFSFADFEVMLKKSSRAIKVLLLDQQKVAGIGNIYDNEALWMAKIHPARLAKSLKPAERKRLFQALEDVLREGINRGGASDNSYLDLFGQKGNYQDFFKVYARKGQPCMRCQTPIERLSLGGRGTFLCPHCQR